MEQFSRLLRSADTHPAGAEAQIHYFIKLPSFLHDRVFSRHADIRGSILYIGRYVRPFRQEKFQFQIFIYKN